MSTDIVSSYFAIPPDPSFVYPQSDFPPLSIFHSKVEHAALVVPAKRAAELKKSLKDILLCRPKTKAIYPIENDPLSRKLVLKFRSQETSAFLDHPVMAELFGKRTDHDSTKTTSQQTTSNPIIQISSHTIEVSYLDWTVEEVLKRLLPFHEVPTSFEIVGHIVHVNLKEEWLPFQYIIGKVILDKNQPRIRTVVNKEGQIESTYRTFGMKVIAGSSEQDWSKVTVKEEGCTFDLDFQQVYWNSRLAGEHRRLVQYIRSRSPGCTVADVMAGVGPFAVPLTATKLDNGNNGRIVVHANDLNPVSFKFLEINSKKNKCTRLHTYNMDGRLFVQKLQEEKIEFDHAIMNLPASAPEFLDSFRGFTGKCTPEIHVHCFASKDNGNEEALKRCQRALGCTIDNPQIHLVRDVSPKKNMLCISFMLPDAARLLSKVNSNDLDSERQSKRIKTND